MPISAVKSIIDALPSPPPVFYLRLPDSYESTSSYPAVTLTDIGSTHQPTLHAAAPVWSAETISISILDTDPVAAQALAQTIVAALSAICNQPIPASPSPSYVQSYINHMRILSGPSTSIAIDSPNPVYRVLFTMEVAHAPRWTP